MVDEDVNFRVINLDVDDAEIKDYALKKKCVVNIFVDHDIDEISGLVDVPNCVTAAQVCKSSQVLNIDKEKGILVYTGNEQDGEKYMNFSSEDEANNINFDDGEDERAL